MTVLLHKAITNFTFSPTFCATRLLTLTFQACVVTCSRRLSISTQLLRRARVSR